MATAYSQKLRKQALYLIATGTSITEASRLLDISRVTLYKWVKQLEKTGSTQPRTRIPSQSRSKITNWQKFQEFVDLHGDKTTSEMATLWGNCTRHTISRGLKKINYTRKKKLTNTKSAVKKHEKNF